VREVIFSPESTCLNLAGAVCKRATDAEGTDSEIAMIVGQTILFRRLFWDLSSLGGRDLIYVLNKTLAFMRWKQIALDELWNLQFRRLQKQYARDRHL
jgi:hypothetical protein